MLEKIVTTHKAYSSFARGPYVKDMFHVLSALGYPYEIETTKVRVVGVSYSLNKPDVRLFRNEYNLSQHSRKGNTSYIPCTQGEIDRLVEDSARQDYLLMRKGIEPDVLVHIEFHDERDKGGSYIQFQDKEGLVEGKIRYVKKSLSSSPGRAASPWSILGVFLSTMVIVQGHVMDSYLIMSVGAGLLAGNLANFLGKNGLIKYIQTTITPKDDSEKAQEKAKSLASLLAEEF